MEYEIVCQDCMKRCKVTLMGDIELVMRIKKVLKTTESECGTKKRAEEQERRKKMAEEMK